jgi:hypothetical protein
MITLTFDNGNSHQVKNKWEELSSSEYLAVLDYIVLFMSGKMSLVELRQMVFLLLTGLRHRLHKDPEKATQQADNISRIAREFTFMFKIIYENQKSFTKLKKEVREQLARKLPSELEQTPEVRWAETAKKEVSIDLVFCKNLLPEIGRRRHVIKGYSFEVEENILITSLTAAQFIDAQTVASEIQESGKEHLLDLLAAILYCPAPYDSQEAAKLAKELKALDARVKKAIYINFNAIQAYLFTRTKYAILFNAPDTKKKPKHNLGLGAVAHSLIKAGYSDVENSNLVKFFELMYTELISTVTGLHKTGLSIDKISEQTGLSYKTINEII